MKIHTIFAKLAPALLAVVGLTTATQSHAQWNPQPGWKDSYAVGGKCYCDSSNFDHGLGQKTAPTPVGELNVIEICNAIEARLGKGPSAGRIPYNDIQCGNGPANDAPDEAGCPGRVDVGPAGCNQIGPKWDLESVYGQWPGSPTGALSRAAWEILVSHNQSDANLAIDGRQSTRWMTRATQTAGQSFVLDMKSARRFDTIVLETAANPNDYPRGYEVYVSDNGTNWGSTIAAGIGSGATTTITLDSVNARYLRILQTGRSTQNWWSIHEINLFNTLPTPSPSPTQTPSSEFLDKDGWSASASANAADVALALDSAAGTRWTTLTPQVPGQRFQIDMKKVERFDAVVLDVANSPNDYPRGYSVYVSNDGSSWGSAIASGNGSSSRTNIIFPAVSARYILLEQTGSAERYWWSIENLNVRASDDTPAGSERLDSGNWRLSASVNDGDIYNAVDGNAATRWTTIRQTQRPGQWITVDMNERLSVDRIVLDSTQSNGDYPRGYQVLVSSDGINFSEPVAAGTGSPDGNTDIAFSAVSTRFIRIVQTGSSTTQWWSIHGLQVYGGIASGTPTPTPSVTPAPTIAPTPTAVPGARFITPSTFVAGSAFQIEVEPALRDGVVSVDLYVNEDLLRTERVYPYRWNGANAGDSRLRSLSAGQHRLRALVSYGNGRRVPAMQEITLTGPQGTPSPTAVPTTTPSPTATPVQNAWSNPATWGGRVPTGGDVTIRTGQSVTLDMNVTLDELTIDGDLSCADKDLRLNARIIMVHGRFDCGTETRPYTKSFVITLTGRKPGDIVNDGRGMGTKVIGVMNGGILSLHGEDRTSWLMLNSTADAGTRQLVLEETTDWRAGDRLVVTSTSQNMKEAEEVVIESINGRVVTLQAPLRHRHFGEIQTFSNGARTWKVDTRAEVGLLTRNIKIIGDGNSEAQKFGGHMMVMRDSEAYISGVQMDRLGQQGLLGRYPFHWHLAGDVSGQYIKNSAIHNSFNRCVTVHGSHNALVDDNVCFKHVGHGYFLEDGIETGNVFNHNLGAWTIKPSGADAIIPSDNQNGLASRGPATFWISNGDNTYTNNAAAGSEGLGFWYDTEDSVTGPSRNLPGGGINPRRSRFGGFTDNRVHSSDMALSICSKEGGTPGYHPPNGTLFKNTTIFYGGNGAVWPCAGDHKFDNLMVLDTGTSNSHQASFVAARPSVVSNSLFVANSALAGNSPKARAAFGIYDFGVETRDSHFENYTEASRSPVFTEVGGALTFMHQSVERVTNRNTNYWLKLRNDDNATSASVIRDLDNSIGFGRNMSLTPDLPLMVDGSCQDIAGIDEAKMCPGRYVQVRLNLGKNAPNIKIGRSDLSITRNTRSTAHPFYKIHMPVNRNYFYEADFGSAFSTGDLRGSNGFSVQVDSGVEGDVAKISLENLKGNNARVTNGNFSRVNSLAELNRSNGNAWFKQGKTIHLRMVCRGNNNHLKARIVANIAF